MITIIQILLYCIIYTQINKFPNFIKCNPLGAKNLAMLTLFQTYKYTTACYLIMLMSKLTNSIL